MTIANTPQAWSDRARLATSHEAALWSEGGQTCRFQAVLRHLHLRKTDTLLDFGCGTGRFSEFLPRGVSYHGLDWSEDMRERAAFDHPQAVVLDRLPESAFDHTVVIGTFNLAANWSKSQTWKQLKKLWDDATKRSLVVSVYRGGDPNCLCYQPVDLADFAKRMNCTTFAIDATYLANDLLLALYR